MRYDMISPGKYLATATGSALGRAKSGTEQVAVGFDVHVTDPETGQPCSVPMTWYGFFTEATIETTDKALAALGFDPAQRDISELNPEEPHLSPIVGAEVDVVLQHKEDLDGNQRLEIRWVNRRGGGLAIKERMAPQEARAFGADVRKRILAARGPGAGAASGPQKGAPAPRGGAPASPQRPAAPAGGRPAVPPRQPSPPRTESHGRPTDPPPGVDYTDDIPF